MRHDDSDYHIDAFLEKLSAMSLEELEHKLPLAQNSLAAIEVELDELLALRDAPRNPRSSYYDKTRYPKANQAHRIHRVDRGRKLFCLGLNVALTLLLVPYIH